jgi:hypothetical protein
LALTVTFPASSFTNPVPLGQVIQRINDIFDLGYSYTIASEEGNSGKLSLSSPVTGHSSRIEIIGGTGVTALGLTVGAHYGSGFHPVLMKNVFEYTFTDLWGDVSYWYKIDYYNSDTGVVGDESDPVQGESTRILPIGQVSLCKVSMINIAGQPTPDMEFRFYLLPPYNLIDFTGGTHTVFFGQYAEMVTDGLGYGEIYLVRGVKVRVVTRGSWFIRDFTVPNQDEFWLFDISADAPDAFSIARPDYTWAAIRRSPWPPE